MTYERQAAMLEADRHDDTVGMRPRAKPPIVTELVNALLPHPKGLRRWSVMRAIRNDRAKASRDVPQKFEADVERGFRRFCKGSETLACPVSEALFYRPEEKAGEVWAVYPDRAKAWLETGGSD
jgi:hypothetical protein